MVVLPPLPTDSKSAGALRKNATTASALPRKYHFPGTPKGNNENVLRGGVFLGNQKKRQFGCTNLYLIIRISACMQASRRLFVCLTTRPAESRPAALRKSASLTKIVKKKRAG